MYEYMGENGYGFREVLLCKQAKRERANTMWENFLASIFIIHVVLYYLFR